MRRVPHYDVGLFLIYFLLDVHILFIFNTYIINKLVTIC